jgi:hypothetical protein
MDASATPTEPLTTAMMIAAATTPGTVRMIPPKTRMADLLCARHFSPGCFHSDLIG